MLEHRWHPRFSVDIPAVLFSQGLRHPCRIRNFSSSGFYVETSAMLLKHQFIELQVDEKNGEHRTIRGMVVHIQAGGVGIEADQRFWPLMQGWNESETLL